MKKKKNIKKILLIIILLLFLTTGCTKSLTDKNNKAVKNAITGQTLTKNIICKPTNKKSIELYKKYNVKIEKLPECKNFKITSGKYEGLWTSIFVKPLSFILIQVGRKVGNYGISVILISILIRLIAYPITKKTAVQSEKMKEIQPQLTKIQKKYESKQDKESLLKQNQEMMALYKKYDLNPMSGCLFAFLQLPIFIAFFEAIQRTPVIFEDKILGLHLGTTPSIGITSATFYSYIILIVLVGLTTYLSFKLNQTANMQDPNMKMMPLVTTTMIVVTGIFMPTGLGIYWVTSNIFTIFQNKIVKRSMDSNGKA